MLRHYTPLTHRCDARCRAFIGSRADCTACETGDSVRYEHTHAVPEWVRRAQSNRLVAKDYTR